MIQYWILIIIGFIFLISGASILVNGASDIAKKFKIPELLIGITIVAIGTSAPELMVAIISANRGDTNLIIGNILGSNFCNLLLTMGIISLIRPVIVDKDARRIHLPVAFAGTVLLFFMGNNIFDNKIYTIDRFEGVVLVLIFLLYFLYPIIKESHKIKETYIKNKTDKKNNNKKVIISILKIIIGFILLKYGGNFVVENAESIAKTYNLSDRIIGFTIVAIGTALPELVTSVIATLKGDTDLAVGNLIGSCVFNTFFIVGIATIICPIDYVLEFNASIILLVISILLIWLFNYIRTKNKINREQGFVLVCIYVIHSVSLFI